MSIIEGFSAAALDCLQHMTLEQFMLGVMGWLSVSFSLWFLFCCNNQKTIGAAALSAFFGVCTLTGVNDSMIHDYEIRKRESQRMETVRDYSRGLLDEQGE